MHIALDLRMVEGQLHGIGRYALELSRRLPALAPQSRFDLLVDRHFDPARLGPALPNVRLVVAKSKFLSVAEQIELPMLLRKLRPDLYHSPSFSVPLAYRGPLALTIHDANHLAFPEHYGWAHNLYYRQLVRPGALRSRLLLTVSQFARGEIERRLDIPRGKLQVIYNGVDASFRPRSLGEIEDFRRRLGLPDRFVLYVGNTKPHKNVGFLIDAFRRAQTDLCLVLCASGKCAPLIGKAGEKRARIRVLPAMDDEKLPLLYCAARVFVFPSLYEGFGLPPLEAMACGTPVVATRATSLPEVLGDAAAFVEPGDSAALAEQIVRLDADRAVAEKHRAAGLERASHFGWEQAARAVLEAYAAAAEPFRVRSRSIPRCSQVPGPRGPRLKVLFCVRHNLFTLAGGDATQILRTKAALEDRGVAVTLWTKPRPPNHGSYDLAHLFHLSRLDTYVQARALARAEMPFVLSTIFWPTHEFEQHGYIGALRLLHAALSGGPADAAKNSVRAILADGDWRWAMFPEAVLPLEHRVRFLVDRALCLMPNSEAEAEVLRGFGASRIVPIVNASDPPPAHLEPVGTDLPDRFVLCAGRIEPRKNQLALVQALQGLDLPLLLVGDAGPMHGAYYRRVQRASGKNVRLLPGSPRERLFSLYAAAEAHIAPAWYETPGLVSLEAAAAGTRVVTTDRGSTREYFGEDAFYLDPSDRQSIRAAVIGALDSSKSPALQSRVLKEYTWQRAGEQTLEAYERSLAEASATCREAAGS